MLRISKLTDYALLILVEIQENKVLSASYLSEITKIPLATTNKILKLLTKDNICKSQSGKTGGFSLIIPKNQLSLLKVVHAIEGKPTSFVNCANNNHCELKNHCKISDKMNLIDQEINQLLSKKFISDLI